MKKSILDFNKMKQEGEKITMLTCYDYLTAKYEEQAGVDIILVGDSVGNVMLGYKNTIPVTMDEMITYAKSVRRGAPDTFIAGDMPFLSYQISDESAISNAGRFIKEAGCDCIKLEGSDPAILSRIRAISDAGMLVIGHVGLTPQFEAKMGGCRAQGKSFDAASALLEQAKKVEEAGAFAIIVEGVPAVVGKLICQNLKIPVIGIGAGSYMDGQVLVCADMLGLYEDSVPKFVKRYANLGAQMRGAFKTYCEEVKSSKFPDDLEHTYKIKDEEAEKIEELFKDKALV